MPLQETANAMELVGVKNIQLALGPFISPDGRHGGAEDLFATFCPRFPLLIVYFAGISTSRETPQSSMNLIVKTALQPNDGHPIGSPVKGL